MQGKIVCIALEYILKLWNITFKLKRYPDAKDPPGSHDIIIVASRHVENVIKMTKCGIEDK